MSLNTGWLIGVSEKDKLDVVESIKHSTTVLRQLKLFVEYELRSLDRVPFDDYETPSWPFKEADRLGQLRVLRKILTLVS